MSENIDFNYVNLSEIDPNQKNLPTAVYTLMPVGQAKTVSYVAKNDPAQVEKSKINVRFAIVGDPNFSGRSLWESFYQSEFSLKTFRRIMDATGVPQQMNEPLVDWLNRLIQEQATFRAKVDEVEAMDKNGNIFQFDPVDPTKPAKQNKINWFTVSPAI